jgi:hypothetical protein
MSIVFSQFLNNIESIMQDYNKDFEKGMRFKAPKILSSFKRHEQIVIKPKNLAKYTKRFEDIMKLMQLNTRTHVNEPETTKVQII